MFSTVAFTPELLLLLFVGGFLFGLGYGLAQRLIARI